MRAVLALIGVLAALAVSACGGSGSTSTTADATTPSGAAQAVAAAGENTADAGSARVSFSATFTGSPSGSMTGEGEFAERQGRMELDLSGLEGASSVLPDGKAELLFDELVYYMKLPEGAGLPLPPGKQWIKLDLQKLGESQGLDLDQLTQLNQSDPSQALDFLGGASDDFRAVGSEEVRGEPTTHYAGTIDLAKVADDAPSDLADAYRKLSELAPTSGVPMDVWVGDDGLVRRLRFEQKLAGDSSMTIEEELYDFGADVDVSPPPDDEVIDLTSLLGAS